MKNFSSMTLAVALAMVAGATAPEATAAGLTADSSFGRQMTSDRPGRVLRSQNPTVFNDQQGAGISLDRDAAFMKSAVDEPAETRADIPYFGNLRGPQGQIWYYVSEYEADYKYINEFYSEEYLKSFKFTIYDEDFKEIGVISDSIYVDSTEVRAREVIPDPAVSTKFFNTDDKYEVMVFFAMNTPEYINHYYYKVYSIDGEKDEKGYDKSLMTIEGQCLEANNKATVEGEEDFVFTFVRSDAYREKEVTKGKEVEYVNSLRHKIYTYKKATETEGPALIFHYDVYQSRTPGDTTSGIYFISKTYNDKLYYIFSQYEKPYFVDPTGNAVDESATPDNSFVIDVYCVQPDTLDLVSTTKIPVETIVSDEHLIYTFLSIGSISWSADVDMSVNGTPEAPAFIVAKDLANAATLEDFTSNYEIYGNDGKLIKTIASDTEAIILYSGAKKDEPQAMFVKVNDNGDYVFEIVNLYTAEKVFSLMQANDGDPLTALSNHLLLPDGKYKYAFMMSKFENDDDFNSFARVAWFNADGTFDRIDKIPVGKNVQAANIALDYPYLDPYLYDKDDAMEYAIQVKRTVGQTTRNEFLVVDDSGKIYADFIGDDEKGDLYEFTIIPGETNRLMMVYNDYSKFYIEFYNLPFVNTAVDLDKPEEELPGDDTEGIEDIVIGDENAPAVYYNLQGVRVDNPENGIYIVRRGNGTAKVLVK